MKFGEILEYELGLGWVLDEEVHGPLSKLLPVSD